MKCVLAFGVGIARCLKVSAYLLVLHKPRLNYDLFIVARHVYGYTKVLDGDSDPERPDGYGPQQV